MRCSSKSFLNHGATEDTERHREIYKTLCNSVTSVPLWFNKIGLAGMARCILLAMALLTVPVPAFALSCAEPSLAREAPMVDVIFQGRLLKIERSFKFPGVDDTGSHLEKATIVVDMPIAGRVTKGQVVNVVMEIWMPLAEGAKDWPETPGEEKKALFLLSKMGEQFPPEIMQTLKLPSQGDVYFNGMCGILVWNDTPENLETIRKSLTAVTP